MIVRKIIEAEVKRCDELFYIAFEFQDAQNKTNEEIVKVAKENPKSRGDMYLLEKWAAFDDNNNMMGWIGTLPLTAQFDGNEVAMTGIGGVSTLPQYRKNGVIRACFNESLEGAYKEGYILSYLYPFSTAYYRKFGYELCSEVIHYYINLRSIKPFAEASGTIHLCENGNLLADIKKVYNDFKTGYNLMCVREDYDYIGVVDSKPAVDGNYIYVYKDINGVAKGVMSFKKVKQDGHFDMVTDMFYFSDFEGLKGLLNHTQAFGSYYEHVVFRLPLNIDITSFIPEWALYSYKRESYFNGMVRVVNVQKALELASYQGSGSLVIKIADGQINENNNTFEVTFNEGKAVEVKTTDNAYDIALTVADFSRLLIGTHSPCDISYIEGVEVKADLGKIGQVFYKKLNYILERF